MERRGGGLKRMFLGMPQVQQQRQQSRGALCWRGLLSAYRHQLPLAIGAGRVPAPGVAPPPRRSLQDVLRHQGRAAAAGLCHSQGQVGAHQRGAAHRARERHPRPVRHVVFVAQLSLIQGPAACWQAPPQLPPPQAGAPHAPRHARHGFVAVPAAPTPPRSLAGRGQTNPGQVPQPTPKGVLFLFFLPSPQH